MHPNEKLLRDADQALLEPSGRFTELWLLGVDTDAIDAFLG